MYRQKPFTSPGSPPLTAWPQASAVARYSLASLAASLCWFYGLTLCGPLRTVLVTEHSPAVLLAGLSALFCASSSSGPNGQPARTRGAVLYVLAILALLLVDHDDNSPHHQVDISTINSAFSL